MKFSAFSFILLQPWPEPNDGEEHAGGLQRANMTDWTLNSGAEGPNSQAENTFVWEQRSV